MSEEQPEGCSGDSVVEELAIRTSKPNRWRNRSHKAVDDLKPRQDEDSKSAWAHALRDDASVDALFAALPRPAASRIFQALNLFILAASNPHAPKRNRVKGISLFRTAFPVDSIVEDSGKHLSAAHNGTHRSLHTDDSIRNEVFMRYGEELEGVDPAWKYNAPELVELASELLERGLVSEEYRGEVEQLVERFSAPEQD